LRGNRKLVLRAIERDAYAYYHASTALRNDVRSQAMPLPVILWGHFDGSCVLAEGHRAEGGGTQPVAGRAAD
jgi:hypothetical protein